jgi:plasmid stabilization system protein ParE
LSIATTSPGMRYRLLLSEDAEYDLKEIDVWSREHYPAQRKQSRDEFRSTLAALSEAPLRWTLWRAPDIRRLLLPHLPYSIIYHVVDQTIVVDAILHQHRDSTRRFPETP